MFRFLVSGIAALCIGATVAADESDQFLSWEVDLSDAAPILNAYVDESIRVVLADANADPCRDRDCQSLTFDIFAYIYLSACVKPSCNSSKTLPR